MKVKDCWLWSYEVTREQKKTMEEKDDSDTSNC